MNVLIFRIEISVSIDICLNVSVLVHVVVSAYNIFLVSVYLYVSAFMLYNYRYYFRHNIFSVCSFYIHLNVIFYFTEFSLQY